MMEFVFESTPWELTVQSLHRGDCLSAVRCLTLLEDMSEDEAEEALLELEDKGVALDVSDLPADDGNGEAALRLRREKELAQTGRLLESLEENDPLGLYLAELAAIPAAGDVDLLAERYAKGDDSVAQQLVNLSLSCVVECACKMAGRGVLLLDLIQEGSLGLWQGILNYTEGDFTAHVTWWIRQYLAKAVLMQARSSGIGQKMRQGMEDYRDMDQRLLGELERNPTLEEIAEAMHATPEEAAVYEAMLSQARLRQQVEQAREPKEEDPEDEQAVEDTAYFQMRQRIGELLSVLPEEDARLLTLRYGLEGGLPLDPVQTGAKLGLTAEAVVAREAAALAMLRKEK